ncbi:MAG: Gfo/Idh/MocA family oxidoreductase [Kiritimatiellae bacterium]|nr:Gfo/Idh/MocA family oxidoreductase [Kiritimatiellia bacterium]
MKQVRLGVVGVGGMGNVHARSVLAGNVDRMRLTAICDTEAARMAEFPAGVARFEASRDLIASADVDAVLVATPHYFHTTVGIEALKHGKHLLVEKPISVHKADCERLIAAHRESGLVFAAMFNQRTDPYYRKLRELIRGGELGEITRVNWIITNWYRTQAYYNSGGWRATWKGEGGGVLLNQCPHNLDLLQWLCGMPVRLRAFCGFGKRHDIEVEDEVTAYLEYANGATGVFVTTTGEAPGTNRLEICGDHGKIVLENAQIRFTRNEVSMLQFSRESKSGFASPGIWNVEVPPAGGVGTQHNGILANFADAILDGAPLLAPGEEGLHSVELANAMVLSSLCGETVSLPMDSARYEKLLRKLIRESRFQKQSVTADADADLSTSFNINP